MTTDDWISVGIAALVAGVGSYLVYRALYRLWKNGS